jgi:hypothetical protein
VGAFFGEGDRHRTTDAAGGAGDDADLILQTTSHGELLSEGFSDVACDGVCLSQGPPPSVEMLQTPGVRRRFLARPP